MAEFKKIEQVPAVMESCANPLLLKELKPWLTEFGKLGTRGVKALEALKLYQDGDLAGFWNLYAANLMTQEDIDASKMPEWWKLNFSGGEFANGDFRSNAQDKTVCEVLQQIRDSHTTWLGPCSACDIKHSTGDYDEYAYNIEVLLKSMGYRYNLQSITQLDAIAKGEEVTLKMVWNNSGVAPIYYNCPVTLMLVDAEGNIAYEKQLSANTTEWQSGRTTVEETLSVPADLAEGTYSLQVRMNAADEKAEIIQLAMEGQTESGSYELYPVSVVAHLDAETEPGTEALEVEPEESDSSATAVALVALLVIVAGAEVIRRKKK